MSWRPEFFEWLDHQLIVAEDWPYVGMNFRGDPDLVIPLGEHLDDRGNKLIFRFLMSFIIFIIITFFIYMS